MYVHSHLPSWGWGDNIKLTLIMLSWMGTQDTILPEDWCYKVSFQVRNILVADIASKWNLNDKYYDSKLSYLGVY